MEEIKIDLAVLKFLFNILRNQVLLEKEIPKDIFFQAQEYISSHNDTLKHTNIYKSYIKHQSSWRQNPQIIKSIQLTTNEKEKCIFLYKLFITSTRSFHPKLFYEFSNINEYQRSKWLNSKYKIPCNEWKIKNGILENLNKCLPGFKFLVEYDVNNIGQIDEQLDDDKYELFDEKVDLSYGGMAFVSEVGVMIVIDLKYPRYKTGSFLEEKRSVMQMEYYRRYKCLNEQVISQKRIEKLKKIVEEKFEEKCIMVIGAKFIDESQLEFYDEFDKLIAEKIKELANITDVESIIKPVINTEENGTCETIGGCLIIVVGFIIYMIIFVYSLKWDLETKEWDFIDVQDDDDVIVEILLTLFQLIFCEKTSQSSQWNVSDSIIED